MKNLYNEFVVGLNKYETKNVPENLFYEGNKELLFCSTRRVSIVGSRKISDLGVQRTNFITEFLVSNNFIIVSGLATGVDSYAHKKALEINGNTIAVIGTPLNEYYPKENRDLQDFISKTNLLISQFPVGYPITQKNFPMRNRTMALISDATIIIEASEKSGTKHQGWEALRLGRPLFILENIIKDGNVTWAKEMIDYGAQVLTNKNYKTLLMDIPFLTAKLEYDF